MCDCDTLEERAHFMSIVNSFRKYKMFALSEVEKTESYFLSLSGRHKKMLEDYLKHLQDVKSAIEHNNTVIQLILDGIDHLFVNVNRSASKCTECAPPKVVERSMTADITRIEASFKHLFRDWSVEGAEERKMCYVPIIDELAKLYPEVSEEKGYFNVLVPGAGLGRLVHDISKLGFNCQGNEFSLFMMFFSQFVLNKCTSVNQYSIYPWVHQSTNNLLNSYQLQKISFPDVNPSELIKSHVSLSMAAGDFLEVYNEPETWDCVVTCFFIDCAHNIVDFIETIFKILRPGGHWINMGPLLYHYSNVPDANSIEPSYQDIRNVILQTGFSFVREEVNKDTFYCQNPKSMMEFRYKSIFFTCEKQVNSSPRAMENLTKATHQFDIREKPQHTSQEEKKDDESDKPYN